MQGLTISLTTAASPVALAGLGIHGVIRVTVRNRGTGNAYLGDSGVTTAGYTLSTADNPLSLAIIGGETLYGFSTGAAVLDVLRVGDTT